MTLGVVIAVLVAWFVLGYICASAFGAFMQRCDRAFDDLGREQLGLAEFAAERQARADRALARHEARRKAS